MDNVTTWKLYKFYSKDFNTSWKDVFSECTWKEELWNEGLKTKYIFYDSYWKDAENEQEKVITGL